MFEYSELRAAGILAGLLIFGIIGVLILLKILVLDDQESGTNKNYRYSFFEKLWAPVRRLFEPKRGLHLPKVRKIHFR